MIIIAYRGFVVHRVAELRKEELLKIFSSEGGTSSKRTEANSKVLRIIPIQSRAGSYVIVIQVQVQYDRDAHMSSLVLLDNWCNQLPQTINAETNSTH
jgi:hypothetical protein